MTQEKSQQLFDRACQLFPGGVNSPVRAFKSVGGTPVFLERGEGPYVWDADGNRYVDFLGSWGPLVLGHAPAAVVAAIARAAAEGTTFGASTAKEVALGEAVRARFPSMERLRFVSSGTEATMSALRVARGFTGRNKIIKIDGGYHGHADMLLAAAGSGAATLGIPGSAGVPAAAVADTIVVPFNDEAAMAAALAEHRGQVAAVIIEPIPGNMGLVPPKQGYLASVRQMCTAEEVILIFDEVISGFRAAAGGAQERFGIHADMTCLGKILGGGLPAGAYGGRADIMKVVAPDGPVYQAGTLSGNPLAMAAGLAMLEQMNASSYERLEALGEHLEWGVRSTLAKRDAKACIQRIGSAFTIFFCPGPVTDFAAAKQADVNAYAGFFHGMLSRGFYLPPAQLEAGFISLAHTDELIDGFAKACDETLAAAAVLR
jgi:glutamate-1-semialdehyde 2,1-aminomutase